MSQMTVPDITRHLISAELLKRTAPGVTSHSEPAPGEFAARVANGSQRFGAIISERKISGN